MALISDRLIRDIWMSDLSNRKAAEYFNVGIVVVRRVRANGYPRVTGRLPHVDREGQSFEKAAKKHLATDYRKSRGIVKLGLKKAKPIIWRGERVIETEIGFISIEEALDTDRKLPTLEEIWKQKCKEIQAGWTETDHRSRWSDKPLIPADTHLYSPMFP